MSLDRLMPPEGAVKKRKRVGRGPGSGNGKTSGKGHKGQRSRAGVGIRGFEGGQMPIQRRLPKRGFKNYPFRVVYEVVNLDRLKDFEAGTVVDIDVLQAKGIINKYPALGVKILGNGELDHALTVRANSFSQSAIQKIEAAGGKTEVI